MGLIIFDIWIYFSLELVLLFPYNVPQISKNQSDHTTPPQENSNFHGAGKPDNLNQ